VCARVCARLCVRVCAGGDGGLNWWHGQLLARVRACARVLVGRCVFGPRGILHLTKASKLFSDGLSWWGEASDY
jgi:hypothetical protein